MYTWLIGLSCVELTTLLVNVVIVVSHRSVETAPIHESTKNGRQHKSTGFEIPAVTCRPGGLAQCHSANLPIIKIYRRMAYLIPSYSSQGYCLMTSHLVSALLVFICLRATCRVYNSLLVTGSSINSYFSL
jgi:hypothetical protein